jgi:site-specific recombinase XerD
LSVAGLFDKSLDCSQKNQAAGTYEWYRIRIQSFLDHLATPAVLPAVDLKPYHVQVWVDARPDWGSTFRHGAIAAIQRPFNWAVDLDYLDRSPVRRIEKPPLKRRERAATPEQWQQMRDHYPQGDAFRDLLLENGEDICKVQELLGHRHVTTTQIYDKRRRQAHEGASHDIPI